MKKFLVKVNGKEYEVEVLEIKTANTGNSVSEAAKPEPHVREPAARSSGSTVTANPAVRTAAMDNTARKPANGGIEVKSPMPGTILKVNVAAGDSVKKGDVLLILEAMKMENEITSPADGIIAATEVSKGSSVNAGDLLVSIS